MAAAHLHPRFSAATNPAGSPGPQPLLFMGMVSVIMLLGGSGWKKARCSVCLLTTTIQIPIWSPSWCTGSNIERSWSCQESAAYLTVSHEKYLPNLAKLIQMELVQISQSLITQFTNFNSSGIFFAKYVPHSFLSRSQQRNFLLKCSLPVASSPIPQTLLAPEVHPFSGLLAYYCDFCHSLSSVPADRPAFDKGHTMALTPSA